MKRSNGEEPTQDSNRAIVERLDKLVARLGTMIYLLLDLTPDERLKKPVSMTEKVGRLDAMGFELEEISKLAGRPSNYISSRLREYKSRESGGGHNRTSKRAAKRKDDHEGSRDLRGHSAEPSVEPSPAQGGVDE